MSSNQSLYSATQSPVATATNLDVEPIKKTSTDDLNAIATLVSKTSTTSSTNSSTSKTPTEQTGLLASIWELKVAALLCFLTAFTGFIFGWDVGTIGGMTNMTSFKTNFGSIDTNTGEYSLPSIIIGLIVSIFSIACAIGGLTLAKVADSWGRKWCLEFALIMYHIGTIIQWSSQWSGSWIHFMIGRIVMGLAIGTTAVVAPMFISESAPLKIRGSMVALYQLCITLGILLGGCINFVSKSKLIGNTQWLFPLYLNHGFALICMIGVAFMPESAVYFVSIDKVDDARKSIARLNSRSDALVNGELDRIVTSHATLVAELEDSNWRDVFTGSPKNFKRLLIGVFIMLFQQFTGCNYFFYYGTSLFASVGIEDSYKTAIILGIVNFAATFPSLYLVERFGRKSCFIVGSIVMLICMTIYASIGSVGFTSGVGGITMIVFTCIYIVGFACTWGPVAFVTVSELYSTKTKAVSIGIATSFNWIANFLISLFTPMITSKIGFNFGFVFAGCLFASIIFVITWVPETKGKTIEDVEEMYR